MASDSTALELLRVQRGRLADRLRPPWWFFPGIAIVWGLFFAGPFTSRSYSSPAAISTWAIVVPALALCLLLQWGMTRATGLKVGPRPLQVLRDGVFSYRPGRPVAITTAVVCFAGLGVEHLLIDRRLIVAAIAVAVVAVAAQVTAQGALLRAVRQNLRDGGGTA